MGQRSYKNQVQFLENVDITFDGGLNTSKVPTALQPNELAQVVNMYYANLEETLVSRPGVKWVANPIDITQVISRLYYYVRSPSEAYLVCSTSTNKLYYWNTGSSTWTLIGAISSSDPAFLTFNAKLLIADGSANIRSWSGTTASYVTTGAAVAVTNIAHGVCTTTNTQYLVNGGNVQFDGSSDPSVAGNSYTITALVSNTSFTISDTSVNPGATSSTNAYKYVPTFHNIDSSPSCTAIASIQGRVAVNNIETTDEIVLSAPEDETNWVVLDGSMSFRAGFGDNENVTGLGVFQLNNLMVFKRGGGDESIYQLNCQGATSGWSISQVSGQNSATDHHTICTLSQDVLFGGIGATGVQSLQGVLQYGDIQVSVTGRPINSSFYGKTIREIKFLPLLGVVTVLVNGDNLVYVYHPTTGLWTTWNFGTFINSIHQCDQTIYIVSSSSILYQLTSSSTVDEMTHTVFTPFESLIKTKTFTYNGKGLVRKQTLFYEAVSPLTGGMYVFGSDGLTPYELIMFSGGSNLNMVGNATELVGVATDKVGTSNLGFTVSHNRFRDRAMYFMINCTQGRLKVRELQLEVALVTG